ncbi:putative transferase CAF17 homolog, mitochondrial [Haliotis rubra]|uniref:putative transferase CAF17 homolog, mitochondrial n=1 Tax=Haliotis rubra TaxID=36100 RepID=UPI001EE609E5|nr:putative transferase CAF17 homolog, mitochondrial [Haliotis rubra]
MFCQKALAKISRTLTRCKTRPVLGSLQGVLRSLWQVTRASSTQGTLHELKSRGLVEMSGRDTVDFLQGIVTSDVTSLGGDVAAQYSMMLNVQGRVLYDLMLYLHPDSAVHGQSDQTRLLLECDSSVQDEMLKVIRRYKIRKKVNIRPVDEEWRLFALVTDIDESGVTVGVPDPRVPIFGRRILHPADKPDLEVEGMELESEEEYHQRRYMWGIPEGVLDLPPGNCFPLESNLVFHQGVSFQKGCYIGQELTARTHHTGVTRKRLMPLVLDRDGASIETGTNITRDDGKNVGKFRNSVGKYGLGLIRMADVKGQISIANKSGEGVPVITNPPLWWPQDVQIQWKTDRGK